MRRRHLLAGVGSIGIASLAGCLGLFGDDVNRFEASPASVEEAARDETEYEEVGLDEIGVEEEFEAAGQSAGVVAINYVTEHEKAVDMGPLGEQRGAVFMVLTTPQISVLGREFNPVEDMSTEELLELVQDNYDDLDDVEHVEDDSIDVLDAETTISEFEGEAQFDGTSVDVVLHVTEAVETNDSLVVTIGVYPEQVDGEEAENIRQLVEAVRDEAPDAEADDGGDSDDGTDDGDDGDDGTDDGDSDDGSADDGDDDGDDGIFGTGP